MYNNINDLIDWLEQCVVRCETISDTEIPTIADISSYILYMHKLGCITDYRQVITATRIADIFGLTIPTPVYRDGILAIETMYTKKII